MPTSLSSASGTSSERLDKRLTLRHYATVDALAFLHSDALAVRKLFFRDLAKSKYSSPPETRHRTSGNGVAEAEVARLNRTWVNVQP